MAKTRRWASLLVAVCLTASLFPAGAVAEEGAQEGNTSSANDINLGASVIEVDDTIYFGTDGTSTASWSVLSTSGNGGSYSSDGTDTVKSSDALFLLSDTLWYQTAFNSNYDDGNTYSGSTLQSTLLDAAKSENNNFTDLEAAAILKTSKDGESTTLNYWGYNDSGLSNDTLFALSANELIDYLGYEADDPNSWAAGASNDWWWLRSAYSFDPNYAGFVLAYGVPLIRNVDYDSVWARPAFNLNLNSVLFTSAAAGGKSSGAVGSDALQSVSTDDYSEWKLTLKDESRNFAIGTTTVDGNTLTVSYSNATTGDDEYISAIVVDSDGNITYYGRIKNTTSESDASGDVTITLPTGFNSSTDTLYLFSEHYNTDSSTDYASALQEVALYSVTNSLTNITTDNSDAFIGNASDYTATLSADGGYSLPDSITVTAGGTTLTAEADYTYSSSTGELTIYSSAITGNIVITAQAVLVDTGDPSTGTGTTDPEGDGSTAGTTDTTGSETDSSTINTAGSTGTTASSTASTSSDASTSSASSDSSLPQTGDTSTALLLGTVATLGLSVFAIALSLAQRRRHRI